MAFWLPLFLTTLLLPYGVFCKSVVDTENGPITGHPAKHASDVNEFLGIPFAKPPVGNLRFEPPQLYTEKKPYTASDFVPILMPLFLLLSLDKHCFSSS